MAENVAISSDSRVSEPKGVLRMLERAEDGSVGSAVILSDQMARAVARREDVLDWFARVYEVPDQIRSLIVRFARNSGSRPAGITLRRFKERGWHAGTTRVLWEKSEASVPGVLGSPIMAAVLRFSDATGVTSARRPGRDDAISDDVWLDAIDLAMMLGHFDEYVASMDDPSRWNWTLSLRGDLPMIYFLVYLLKSREDSRILLDEAHANLREAGASLLVHERLSEGLVPRAVAEAETEAVRARLRAELDAERAETARLRKRVSALEHANADLARASELTDASLEHSEAACGPRGVSEGEDTSAVTDGSEGLSGPSTDDLPELPRSGVVFLGGHTRVVRQLRQFHPDWDFIGDVSSAGRLTLGATTAVEVVFCWYGHLTHPTFERVTSALPGVPVGYVSATNIARLESEMRACYADVLERAAAAAGEGE